MIEQRSISFRRPGVLAGILIALLYSSICVASVARASSLPVTKPVLVVFAFHTADDIDPASGVDYAAAIGAAIAATRDINVVIGDPATRQADYLHATLLAAGDYYLTGFMGEPTRGTQPILEQIVSKRSGTAVWGKTAQITIAADIQKEAQVIADALNTYETRGFYPILNPLTAMAPTPPANAKPLFSGSDKPATGMDRSRDRAPLAIPHDTEDVSSQKSTPSNAYASPANPKRFVLLAIGPPGQQSRQNRYVESSLLGTLLRHGQTAAVGDPATTSHSLVHPQDTCAATGAAFLLFPKLSINSSDMAAGVDAWTDARLQLLVWNCDKRRYDRPDAFIASAFSSRSAIDRATLKTVTTYLTKL